MAEDGSHHAPGRQPATDDTPAGPFFETSPPPLPSGTATVTIPSDMEGIAELPPADQLLALEQRTCPVTGDLLGSMGKPIKVPVGDQFVFVCCQGCVDTVRANPDQYLGTSDESTAPVRVR